MIQRASEAVLVKVGAVASGRRAGSFERRGVSFFQTLELLLRDSSPLLGQSARSDPVFARLATACSGSQEDTGAAGSRTPGSILGQAKYKSGVTAAPPT